VGFHNTYHLEYDQEHLRDSFLKKVAMLAKWNSSREIAYASQFKGRHRVSRLLVFRKRVFTEVFKIVWRLLVHAVV
jgi:hypothetical protein